MTDWDELKRCRRGDAAVVADWNRVVEEGRVQEQQWISELRKQGFKAAHPNDGWVDRVNNTIILCYPQFDDGVTIGDKIMLGWAGDPKVERPVRIINIRKYAGILGGNVRYIFEDLK